MPFLVEKRNFPMETIDSDIKHIANSDVPLEIRVWEKTKELFSSIHKVDFLECIQYICHPPEGTTWEDLANKFDYLRTLAHPGSRESIQSGRYGEHHFCILDEKSREMLSVVFDGVGTYTVECEGHKAVNDLNINTQPLNKYTKVESVALSNTERDFDKKHLQLAFMRGEEFQPKQFEQISPKQDKSNSEQANIIKYFLKKTIAAQCYNKMFSNGAHFKELGIDLAEPLGRKATLHSLQHLNNVSKRYLTKIKDKTQNLNAQETILLSKVIDAKIHFRHQSNSNLTDSNGTLNIMSINKLQSNNIFTAKNTYLEDIRCLCNHDFVFFGVEFSNEKTQLPLNTRHTTVDFGANAYIVDEQFPYGYLTLTDHFDNKIPPAFMYEHKNFITQFSEVKYEVHRDVHSDDGRIDVPIFNTKDMKLGLGFHLINFLRNSSDTGFRKFALNEDLDNKNLDRILNFVFQPEFHVPRMVSTNNYIEVKLREISAEEAVRASNFASLSSYIKNKDEACKIMELAVKYAKIDVVNFLFSQFNFIDSDTNKMSSSIRDFEFSLSDSCADENILKCFLERGLVDPNKVFRKSNSGDTMLDNAIKYNKKEMIDILLEYGALRGKEIKDLS